MQYSRRVKTKLPHQGRLKILHKQKYSKRYLPWTANAETPVFSIRRANSTVSWDDFNSRILHVTCVSRFLFNVVKIWISEKL